MFSIRNGSHYSLDEIHRLYEQGVSVLRSAHIGNFNAATLFIAQEGFPVIVDEHATGSMTGFMPAFIRQKGDNELIGENPHLPSTHLTLRPDVFEKLRTFSEHPLPPARLHVESLKKLFPNALELTSSFFLDQEPFLASVLEAMSKHMPTVFRKYVDEAGAVFMCSGAADAESQWYRNEHGVEMRIQNADLPALAIEYLKRAKDSVEGIGPLPKGVVVSTNADLLLLTMCEIYKGRNGIQRFNSETTTVIHFAGVQMMNYLIKNMEQSERNAQELNELYAICRASLAAQLPARIVFELVPTDMFGQLASATEQIASERSEVFDADKKIEDARFQEKEEWKRNSETIKQEVESFGTEVIAERVRSLLARSDELPGRARKQVLTAESMLADPVKHMSYLVQLLVKEAVSLRSNDTGEEADEVILENAKKEYRQAVARVIGAQPLEITQYDMLNGAKLFFPESARSLSHEELRIQWNRAVRESAFSAGAKEDSIDFEAIRRSALTAPRVTSMLPHFEAIASGALQVPGKEVRAAAEFLESDSGYEKYHRIFQRNIGTFYKHGCASIPFIMEENIRVGTALYALAKRQKDEGGSPLAFYETSSADGSNARTLAEYAHGLIRTLTDSPNESNQLEFKRLCSHGFSFFHKGPFVDITPEYLEKNYAHEFPESRFDVIWENTTFQMYGAKRDQQIAYVQRVLKDDGLMLFLEKMHQGNPAEYKRREDIKDTLYKSKYFTDAQVNEKKRDILSEMEDGQVSLEALTQALRRRFKHAYLIWNSANFYEIAASNSKETIDMFLENLGTPYVPMEFACESSLPRALW